MSRDTFDLDAAFDDDYLYFYAPYLTAERTQQDVELIADLLELAVGDRVLDLACGHGRIALPLAAIGCRVTGFDRSPAFLALAQRDAAAAGLEVDWVAGDMRELDFRGEFDAVVHWFTSFGYFDDDTDRDVLRRIHQALVPGGRLLIESLNLYQAIADPSRREIKRVGGDVMEDESDYDPHTGRIHHRRTVSRAGHPPRAFDFSVRLFTPTELASWLRDAGFREIDCFGGEGEPFDLDSERLVVVASRAHSGGGRRPR